MNLLNEFRFIRPDNLGQAVAALAEEGSHPLSGGTDLLPNLRRGLVGPKALVDLSRLNDLKQLRREGDSLILGAGLTLETLAEHPEIREQFPVLRDAILAVAGPSHRASATLGGNLCQDTRCIFYNQSEWWRRGNDYCLKYQGKRCHVVVKSDRCYATYHGDIAPVLMVLDAEAELIGPAGTRSLTLDELYREDGSRHLALQPGELLASISLKQDPAWLSGYDKMRVRDAIDFPLAGTAVALRREGENLTGLRLVVTGTNSIPIRVELSALEGRPWGDESAEALAKTVRKAVNVLKTTVTGAKYRRRVVMAMARRLVDRLWQQAA